MYKFLSTFTFLASVCAICLLNSCDPKQPIPLTIDVSISDSICQNIATKFQDKGTGATSWAWTFGDGTTSSAQNPSHTYTSLGNFTLKLTVSDGNETKSISKNIVVKNCNSTGNTHKVIFKFKFDSTQVRLNNLGQVSTIPAGHAALSPKFHAMAAHYIELAPTMFTALGSGSVLYHGVETTVGGTDAIDFDLLTKAAEGETFFSIPIANINPGTYQYLRVSLAYQNYDVPFKYVYTGFPPFYFTGRIASFLGFNSYIRNYTINTQTVTLNSNKKQGYWGFELPAQAPYIPTAQTQQGDAPGTTVVNPIASTSPIPIGSCVVTSNFSTPLQITGNETQDIIIMVSLSTNKSFEWIDTNPDGKFEPAAGEIVVDMGVRGMVPIVQ
jgi:PKD repeat protein